MYEIVGATQPECSVFLALVPRMLVCISELAVSSAWVDGMLVVETSTHRVSFDNLIAHCGTKSQQFERSEVCSSWREVMKLKGANATSVAEYNFTDSVNWRMRR